MGLIDDKYAMLGGDHGFLGPPKSPGEDFGRGRRRKYAFGEIRLDLTAPDPQEAFEVHGAILDHLRTVESPTDPWFPTSDELMTRDGAGRISYFDGAAIVWRKDLGAFAVQGAIYNKWIRVGGVRSAVGYPISDEHASTPPTRRSTFEHGVIDWPGHDWRPSRYTARSWQRGSHHRVHHSVVCSPTRHLPRTVAVSASSSTDSFVGPRQPGR